MKKKHKIIVIVGPTASGKSELGVRIAKKLRGEIISADSRQVYRGLDVGSGKVPGKWIFRKENNNLLEYFYKGVRHHCIDIANPKKTFTAADFVACGRRAIADILSRGKTPIIVGGTGFYIDALLGRIQLAMVPPNKTLRKKLASYSTTQLFNYITKLDPARAKSIDKNNPRRLIRAIEVVCATKQKSFSLSSLAPASLARGLFRAGAGTIATLEPCREIYASSISPRSKPVQSSSVLWLGIKRSPEELKKRIYKRLIVRLPGIIREVKKLRHEGLSWKRLYDLGLEYRYVSLYVQRNLDYKLMTTKLKTDTWRYAKHQMTWWKCNKNIRWISNSRNTKKCGCLNKRA